MGRPLYRANVPALRRAWQGSHLTQEELAKACGFEDRKIITDMLSDRQFETGRRFEYGSLEIVEKTLNMSKGSAFL